MVTITGGGSIIGGIGSDGSVDMGGGGGGNGVQGDVTLSGSVTITGGAGGSGFTGVAPSGYGVRGNVTLSGSATIIGGGSSGSRKNAVMDTITAATTDTVILGGYNASTITDTVTSGTTSSYPYIKAQAVYAISKATATNGSFTVKVGTNEVTQAAEGDTVTITPTADSGYTVDAVTVTKTGTSDTVTVTNNSFTMPAYGVTVTVTFKGTPDRNAVTAAMNAVVDSSVNVAFGADQTAKTAAVQTYVNSKLTGNATGVTATVTHTSGNSYLVEFSKGSVSDSKSITMSVTESPAPDIATIAAAKSAAENAAYTATTQADCTDENTAKAYVENIAKAAVNNNGVTVAVNKVSYTAPIAGTAANPSGTNGSYKFTVTVSKGAQSDTTGEKTITITATPYTSSTHKPVRSITGIPTTATANVPLLLTGTVNPADATNKTIVWSVKSAGTTGATITGSTLNTTAAGSVVVTATIVNGAGVSTDYTQDATITVSAAPTTDAEKIAAVKAAIESVLSNLTVSNATTAQDILDAANGVASNGVTVAWDSANGFAKTDATADATGSITGSLKLTLNSQTATVAVNKTIPKLTATAYTVTLDANGGSVSPTGLSVEAGGTAALPTPTRSGSYRFDGWFTAENGGTQYTNSTPINSNVTLYARWTYTGGGSSDGSGSSSGGDVIVTPPSPDKPNAPTESEIKVPGKVDGNGNATATVTDKAVSDAIKQAEDTARKNGNLDNGITLVLNVDTGSKTANTVSVNLPRVTQETILSKKIVNTVLVVNNPDIQIGIDLAAVKEINTQAKADVSISATRMDNAKLTGAAKTAIGNRPVFDLKATYQNGAKSITGFGGGSVSVALPYTLQAGEVPGGLYAVYVDANGKVSYITGSSYDAQNKVLRFATNHFSVYGVGYKAPASFTDIASHWAKPDIEFVANRGLMNGTSNTTFSPNGAITRGMLVTALGRLAGIDRTKYTNTKFTDVAATSSYAPYVAWATEKGIAVGTTASTFGPDNIVTRQEMGVFMSNYAKAMNDKVPQTREAITFADSSSIGSWAAAAVKQMQVAGVLNGKNGNRFDPTGTATRGEMAAVLRRYVELVIDPATAQGLDVNDSGSAMLYENGKLVKNQSRTVNSRTYNFNANGEAALPADSKKYILHIVKKNEYFYSISRMYGCTQQEIMALNGLQMGDVICSGDVLKVPQQ